MYVTSGQADIGRIINTSTRTLDFNTSTGTDTMLSLVVQYDSFSCLVRQTWLCSDRYF